MRIQKIYIRSLKIGFLDAVPKTECQIHTKILPLLSYFWMKIQVRKSEVISVIQV